MKGIVRPCSRHLGPELHARWQSHLCGLCLTLRDLVGQPERALTGFDVLLLSVLVEAQAGRVETTQAAPCPLRGMRGAGVVASSSSAAQLAAAGALLGGSAALTDKLDDGDLRPAVRAPARRVAERLSESGRRLAGLVGLDPAPVLQAPALAAQAEQRPGADLRSLLRPTGDAVAALFAHTAVVAGVPANAAALARCGRAFGQLVHLLDAVEDRRGDLASDRFNPLVSTGADAAAARLLADELVAEVVQALSAVALTDRALVDVLLGPELCRAVGRVLPDPEPAAAVPQQRAGGGAWAVAVAAWTLVAPAVFVGGSWGGSSCGSPRRRRGYSGHPPGYDGYPPVEVGYRRIGPSCGQMLACNCCANLACNACCCGNQCANG